MVLSKPWIICKEEDQIEIIRSILVIFCLPVYEECLGRKLGDNIIPKIVEVV